MVKEKKDLTKVELYRLFKNAENLYKYGFLKKRDYDDIAEDISEWVDLKE